MRLRIKHSEGVDGIATTVSLDDNDAVERFLESKGYKIDKIDYEIVE